MPLISQRTRFVIVPPVPACAFSDLAVSLQKRAATTQVVTQNTTQPSMQPASAMGILRTAPSTPATPLPVGGLNKTVNYTKTENNEAAASSFSQTNWSKPINQKRFNKALRKCNNPTNSIRAVSRDSKIPYSTLWRAVGKGRPPRRRRSRRRKFACDILLRNESVEVYVGPITTFIIQDVMHVWKHEFDEEHAQRRRKKLELFVMLSAINKYAWPKSVVLKGNEQVHIILHMGRHIAYVYIDLLQQFSEYHDSGNAQASTRSGGSHGVGIMETIEMLITKTTTTKKAQLGIYAQGRITPYIVETPKQDNDIDCGVFALWARWGPPSPF